MLQVQSLCFDYHDRAVLNNVQFMVKKGQMLHLQGKNGAGKTTLLRLLAGLLSPLTGAIHWQQQSIYNNLTAYQRDICYIGHKNGLNLALTVKENCLFDACWRQGPNDAFEELLIALDLMPLMDTCCYHLSQGQRRRVALMRLAMRDTPLWLLDEPLVGLDKESTSAFFTYLKTHLNKEGMVVISSHQPLPNQLTYQDYLLK